MGLQVQHIDHVELLVTDFEAALEWYREVLGLVPVEMTQAWTEAGEPVMISSDGGKTMLALFHGEGPGDREYVGHQRVAFRVDASGFIAFLDHIERVAVDSRDGGLLTRDQVVGHDLAWSICFRDPWDNPCEITSYEYDEVKRALAA